MSFNKKMATKYAMSQRKNGLSVSETFTVAEAHVAGFDTAAAMLKVLLKRFKLKAINNIEKEDGKVEYWKGFEDAVDEIDKSFNLMDKESYSQEE